GAGRGVAAPAPLPTGLPPAGEGRVFPPGLLGEPIAPRFPSAATLAGLAAGRLAAGDGLLPPEPLYLRRPDARVPGPPKSVLTAAGWASRAGLGGTPP